MVLSGPSETENGNKKVGPGLDRPEVNTGEEESL
jgi:hypothetical protein